MKMILIKPKYTLPNTKFGIPIIPKENSVMDNLKDSSLSRGLQIWRKANLILSGADHRKLTLNSFDFPPWQYLLEAFYTQAGVRIKNSQKKKKSDSWETPHLGSSNQL